MGAPPLVLVYFCCTDFVGGQCASSNTCATPVAASAMGMGLSCVFFCCHLGVGVYQQMGVSARFEKLYERQQLAMPRRLLLKGRYP